MLNASIRQRLSTSQPKSPICVAIMTSTSYVRCIKHKRPGQQINTQKRLKFEALSPMECCVVASRRRRRRPSMTVDSDDESSRDSGIGSDTAAPCSPSQLFSSPVNRRLDFAACLSSSPANTSANVGDNDLAVKSSSCHFAERRQPLSPVVDDGVKGRTTRRRTGRTACVSVTTPSAVDEPPCRPAAAADRPSPGDTSMMDIDDADDNDQLIGDFSRPCSLPVLDGKHADLPSISPDTLARVLCSEMRCAAREQILIIDCRYPYEYDAGHIKGAINIYTKTNLKSTLLRNASPDGASERRSPIVIFHCEFSSKRGPSLARFLRQCDRASHADSYPSLSYPELYVLEGGYRAFYEQHGGLCWPRDYRPMLQSGCELALRQFRAECKRDSRRLKLNGAGGHRLKSSRVSSDVDRRLRCTLRF